VVAALGAAGSGAILGTGMAVSKIIEDKLENQFDKKEESLNKALDVLLVTAQNNNTAPSALRDDNLSYYTRLILAILTVSAAGGAAWSDKFRYHTKDIWHSFWNSSPTIWFRDVIHLRRDKTQGTFELKEFKEKLNEFLGNCYDDYETIEKLKKAEKVKILYRDDEQELKTLEAWVSKRAQSKFNHEEAEKERIVREFRELQCKLEEETKRREEADSKRIKLEQEKVKNVERSESSSCNIF